MYLRMIINKKDNINMEFKKIIYETDACFIYTYDSVRNIVVC